MNETGKLIIDHNREGQGTIILTISGDLDVKTAPQLKKFIESVIKEGDINLKLDLSRLSYLDSSGYGVLVDATRRTKAIKGSLDLSNMPPWMTEFFDMSALEP
jgi:anti-anti-sigma factor